MSAHAGTKRRKYTTPGEVTVVSSSRLLSNRITKLAKSLKAVNPSHLWDFSPNTFQLNSTGAAYDVAANIIQGDAYNQRYGNKIVPRRFLMQTTILPGSTQATPAVARIALVRATYNLGGGPIQSSTISPTANTNILQVYYDRIFVVPNTLAFPVNIRMNVPIKLSHIKFSGSGINATVAESVFLLYSSNAVAGTTAPVFTGGIAEFYFSP